MFTGIVEEVGRVIALEVDDGRAHLHVGCDTVVADATVGDSISVDGCCLTITSLPGDGFTADVMLETLRVTALEHLTPGAAVNLERAMSADGRFGGHLVQGHVDGVGRVVAREQRPGTVLLSITVPGHLVRHLVDKGSLTVAGVSLTIVEVADEVVRIGLIPHTLDATNLGQVTVGDHVNLEVDVVAKYVERLLAAGSASPYRALHDVDEPFTDIAQEQA